VHAELAHLTPAQRLLRRPWLGPLLARLASAATYKLQVRRILGRRDALSAEEPAIVEAPPSCRDAAKCGILAG
jgi:hypothetical protein